MIVEGLGTIEVARELFSIQENRLPPSISVMIVNSLESGTNADYHLREGLNTTYECEFNCGFRGTFLDVERHETTCNPRSKRRGVAHGEKRTQTSTAETIRKVEEMKAEITTLKAEIERLRNVPINGIARRDPEGARVPASRAMKRHKNRMESFRKYIASAHHALQLVEERLLHIGVEPRGLSEERAASKLSVCSFGSRQEVRGDICGVLDDLLRRQDYEGCSQTVGIAELLRHVNESLRTKGLREFAHFEDFDAFLRKDPEIFSLDLIW